MINIVKQINLMGHFSASVQVLCQSLGTRPLLMRTAFVKHGVKGTRHVCAFTLLIVPLAVYANDASNAFNTHWASCQDGNQTDEGMYSIFGMQPCTFLTRSKLTQTLIVEPGPETLYPNIIIFSIRFPATPMGPADPQMALPNCTGNGERVDDQHTHLSLSPLCCIEWLMKS